MKTGALEDSVLKEIFRCVLLDPEQESCGVVLEYPGGAQKVIPVTNAQNRLHEQDPECFPRTARTAYAMDPAELLALHKHMRREQGRLCVIWHSHIDAEAVFSEEDRRQALFEGAPLYAEAAWLVVSVVSGQVRDYNLYFWNPKQKEFLP